MVIASVLLVGRLLKLASSKPGMLGLERVFVYKVCIEILPTKEKSFEKNIYLTDTFDRTSLHMGRWILESVNNGAI